MARAAAIGNSSWVLPLRIAQLVFAILVFSLASYTLDKITGWKEVRFTVAAVPPLPPTLLAPGTN
jgi:hypothetical protein